MRFEPRSVLAEPGAFGDVGRLLQPKEGIRAGDHQYQAAMIQHILARQIHESLALRGQTLPAYLQELGGGPGLNPDRVRRLLRGESSASLSDLMFWAGQFPAVGATVAKYVDALSSGAPRNGVHPRGAEPTIPRTD